MDANMPDTNIMSVLAQRGILHQRTCPLGVAIATVKEELAKKESVQRKHYFLFNELKNMAKVNRARAKLN